MPGIVYSTSSRPADAWEIMKHSDRLRFHPIEAAGAYSGRVCNGIFNPGPHARSESLAVAIDGEFSNRESIWSALGDRDGVIPHDDQHLIAALLSRKRSLREILSQAEGQFFVMAYEAGDGTIQFGSDRFGLRPHYWARSGSQFVLAPEVKFCLAEPWMKAEFNPLSLAEYFNFQCVMEERTLFNGVEVFPAGSIGCFQVHQGSWEIEEYLAWNDLCGEPFRGSFEEAVEEASHLFKAAVRRASQGRCGIYLSGGLDSRQILAAMPETKGLPTFCFGPSGSPDIVYARQCARIARTDHHEFLMEDGRWLRQIAEQHTRLAEGFHCLWHSHNLWRAEEAGQHIEVNLHGHFGDLLLGGSYIPSDPSGSGMAALMDTFQRKWGGMFEQIEDYVAETDPQNTHLTDEVISAFKRSYLPFAGLPPVMADDLFALHYHGRKQIQYYVIHNRSWFEARFPFLDLPLLRFLYSLPSDYRRGRRLQIAVLERLNAKLAAVPWAKTFFPASGRPLDIAKHKAKTYLDRFLIKILTGRRRMTPWAPLFNQKYCDWIDQDLRMWINEVVSSSDSMTPHLFEDRFLSQILENPRSGVTRDSRSTWLLGCVTTIELLQKELNCWNIPHSDSTN